MHRIDRRGLKIEVQVEPAGVLVNGMNQQSANTDDFSGLSRSPEGV